MQMSSKKGPSVHVVPAPSGGGTFVAKIAGNPNAVTRPTTQQKAIEKAIPIAKRNQSEVVIHNRKGQIRDSDSYGDDPNPPKDKKH